MNSRIKACEDLLALILGTNLPIQVPFQPDQHDRAQYEKYQRALTRLEQQGVELRLCCLDCSSRGIKARGFLEMDKNQPRKREPRVREILDDAGAGTRAGAAAGARARSGVSEILDDASSGGANVTATINICADRIALKSSEVKSLLDHELVHAYDYSLQRCDFTTIKGLAYSEVRAAKVAECGGWFLHDYFRISCIKDHAIRSTEKIFPVGAKDAVDDVFDSAMRDMEPYASSTTSSIQLGEGKGT